MSGVDNPRVRKRTLAPHRRTGTAALSAALWLVLSVPRPAAAQSVIVNEMSQGSGGAKEWVELLVTAENTDLRGWTLGDCDDGGWTPICTFADAALWQAAPAGLLIVIYNGGDPDGMLLPEDDDASDDAVTMRSDNAAYFVDAAAGWPSPTQGAFGNDDRDDAPGLHDADGQLVFDMAVTHPTARVQAPRAGQAAYFLGGALAQVTNASSWTIAASTSATPGGPNGGDNTAWIERLRHADLPLVSFGAVPAFVAEDVGALTLPVVLDTPGTATVRIDIAAGNATPDQDFALSSTTIVFNGSASAETTLSVVEDTISEPAEWLELRLTDPIGALVSTASTVRVTIRDNDSPTLSFTQNALSVHEPTTAARLTVRRFGDVSIPVGATVRTEPASAHAGLDYRSMDETIDFAPEETNRSVIVAVHDDSQSEPNETFTLELLAPTGGAALATPSTATITIVDDENIASNYYAGIFGLTGTPLRHALHQRISAHQPVPYESGTEYMPSIDECPTNNTQVWLLYSREGRDAAASGSGSNTWNREHVWPRSHGFEDPDFLLPPSRDLHNIRAADADVNVLRANKDFAAGGFAVPDTPPTCRTDDDSFEPPDASKGDVARIAFYMDVRYEGDAPGEPDLVCTNGTGTSGARLGDLATLLRWHFADPPDAFERRRNDRIYRDWQGNRNPFIDHPEWAMHLWGPGIVTTHGHGGTISPENPVVNAGDSRTFTLAPSNHYYLAAARTNGVALNVAPTGSAVAWSNITATGTLEADFAPYLAAGLVPHAWLAAHALPTNDDSAFADGDADGLPNWKEYVADTCPTQANAAQPCIAFMRHETAPDALLRVTVQPSSASRYYLVQAATDLAANAWQPVSATVRGTGAAVELNVAPPPPSPAFLRATVSDRLR